VLDELSSPLPLEKSDRGEESERLGGLLDVGTSAGKIQAVGQHLSGDEGLGSENSEAPGRSNAGKGLDVKTSGKTSLSERIYAPH